MKKTIIVGTRKSKLALWQTAYVGARLKERYPKLSVEESRVMTEGDRILDVPLAKIGGKGLFTKELEKALLAGEIDIAVHSLKDMPTELPEGLVLAAVTVRAEPSDALVSPRYRRFEDLPQGARVGTSSLRRKAQLLAVRPDLCISDLRGNVNTRLAKLDAGEYDAIVLAAAGLNRLGFADRIASLLPHSLSLPAAGQGILAIEARADDAEVLALLACLNDEESRVCTETERAFLRFLEGGCQAPMAVHAVLKEGVVTAEGMIASVDGKTLYRHQMTALPKDAAKLGEDLAKALLSMGGIRLLHEMGLLTGLEEKEYLRQEINA